MELKKLMTIFVVFLAVLAAMSTIIEAQRGGGHGGGMGGGHHWSVNAGSDNNNVGNNAGAIDVYVSTDKRMYALGEPIEITVTAYNPTGYAVEVEYQDPCVIPLSYIIDGYYTPYDYGACGGGASPGTLVFQPYQTITRTFIRSGGTYYVPLPVGRHSVVGTISGNSQYESRPITIRVVQ